MDSGELCIYFRNFFRRKTARPVRATPFALSMAKGRFRATGASGVLLWQWIGLCAVIPGNILWSLWILCLLAYFPIPGPKSKDAIMVHANQERFCCQNSLRKKLYFRKKLYYRYWPQLVMPFGKRYGGHYAIIALAFFALRALVFAPGSLYAAESEAGRELYGRGQIYNFARFLYKRGEYFRAITEYQRLMRLYPHYKSTAVRRGVLQSFFHGGAYTEGIRWVDRFLMPEKSNESAPTGNTLFYKAIFHYQAGQFVSSRKLLQDLPKRRSASAYNVVRYYLFWNYLSLGQWTQAQTYLDAIDPEKPIQRLVMTKADNWREWQGSMQKLMRQRPELSPSRPWLGGVLSTLLPGLGQVSQGRWRDGVVSFVTVGLFAGLSYLAFEHDETGTGYAMGTAALFFYSANIYGGYMAGYRRNELIKKKFLSDARQKGYMPANFHGVE